MKNTESTGGDDVTKPVVGASAKPSPTAQASGEDPMIEEQAARADFEHAIRRKCAEIAAAEYEYWKMMPVSVPGSHRFDMQIAAMGAAANICAAIIMGRSAKQYADGIAKRRSEEDVSSDTPAFPPRNQQE